MFDLLRSYLNIFTLINAAYAHKPKEALKSKYKSVNMGIPQQAAQIFFSDFSEDKILYNTR